MARFLSRSILQRSIVFWTSPSSVVFRALCSTSDTSDSSSDDGIRIRRKKVKVGDRKIYVEKTGYGPHPLLCMCGAARFSTLDFGPILPLFSRSEKFTTIAWDPPGFGRSRPPERDFSGGVQYYYRDADWAFELMKALGHSKFSILGSCDGAKAATILAAKYPDSVIKLITLAPNSFITAEDMEIYNNFGDIETWPPTMSAPLIQLYGKEKFKQMMIDWSEMSRQIYEGGGDIFKTELGNVKCPTLIVHGLEDPIVPYRHSEYILKHIPNSWLYCNSNSDGRHVPPFDNPEAFIELVEDFLLSSGDLGNGDDDT